VVKSYGGGPILLYRLFVGQSKIADWPLEPFAFAQFSDMKITVSPPFEAVPPGRALVPFGRMVALWDMRAAESPIKLWEGKLSSNAQGPVIPDWRPIPPLP
jgi:hypothetical protein